MAAARRRARPVRDTGWHHLHHRSSYEDFALTLEYKTSKECNSGVFFRTDPKNPVQGGMEIQIASPGLYRGKHVVGALFDAKEPVSQNSKPDGEWNTFHLTCIGSRLIATINGRKVQTADLNAWVTPNQNPDGSKNKFNRGTQGLLQNTGTSVCNTTGRTSPSAISRCKDSNDT